MDIGTPERYLQASWDILERRVETEPGAIVDERGVFVAADAEIDGAARVGESVFAESAARVDAGAKIGPRAVLGPSSGVGEGAVVRESVLHRSCEIDPGAEVIGSILAPSVRVGARAVVEPGCVIGQGAAIDPGATVPAGSRIEPAAEVV
jgi:mannose-1-phosphate guanylyltransferase